MDRKNRICAMRRDESGAALVEGTIVFPFLCILVFGVFEFSYIFYQQQTITTGVRDAAHYLARSPDPSDATTQTSAQNLATTGTIAGGTVRRVAGWNPGNVTIAITTIPNPVDGITGLRAFRGGPEIPIINVTGTFAYVPLGFLGFFGLSAPTIAIVHSERYLGWG